MTITLNGQPTDTSATTLATLIAELHLPAQTVLIEHNTTALRRSEWSTTPLTAGDRIELLHVAAGG